MASGGEILQGEPRKALDQAHVPQPTGAPVDGAGWRARGAYVGGERGSVWNWGLRMLVRARCMGYPEVVGFLLVSHGLELLTLSAQTPEICFYHEN